MWLRDGRLQQEGGRDALTVDCNERRKNRRIVREGIKEWRKKTKDNRVGCKDIKVHVKTQRVRDEKGR